MSYLDDVAKELRPKLGDDGKDEYVAEWAGEVISFVRQKLLESYKNGAQTAIKQLHGRSSQNQNKSSKAKN